MVSKPVSDHTRVVVAGAGIIGCSAAFHLLKLGLKSVTIIDAGQAGAATTGAGAGFVSHWSAGFLPELGEEGLALQEYALQFYRMLHELGTDIGYRPSGTLQLALTESGFEQFARPVLASRLAPRETKRLSAVEVGVVMRGLVDPAQVYGGVLNPHGIQIETASATAVLADQIKSLGGDLRLGTTILGIEETGGAIRIGTPSGPIDADLLIIAAGAWNNELLAMLGARVPLLRMLATRIVTDARGLSQPLPTIQCREFRLWMRESFGAITWGSVQGYTPLHRLEHADESLALAQPRYPHMLERLLEQQHESLERVFPPLRGSRVASWSQGVPCYTPDHNLIAGRLPGHAAILLVGGDNESGVTHGPGLGRLIADLAVERAPFVDPTRWRCERFDPHSYPTEESIEAAMTKSFVVASVREPAH